MDNFKALSLEDFLKGIDSLDIYEKDYRIIQQLLNVDGNFFVKVLEEVLLGNLYFSDFERIFKDDTYAELLKRNFEVEKSIIEEAQKLSELRTRMTTAATSTNEIGLTREIASHNEKLKKYFTDELKEQRDDFLYQIFSSSQADSELETLAKLKMFNAIKNYPLANIENLEDKTKIKINDFGKLEYAFGDETLTADYFDPEDLLFFVNEGVLPIAYEYQTISSIDEDFMKANNISLAEMKKIKALSSFLRANQNMEGDTNE